ncbi:MAG: YdcF family protein [Polyangiaceae bacterium]
MPRVRLAVFMRSSALVAAMSWVLAMGACSGPALVGASGATPSTCEIPPMDELYPGPAPPNPYTATPEAGECIAQEHDAIIILGCPSNQDGTPSDCQKKRADMAVTLFEDGYGAHFIVSGAAVHAPGVEAEVLSTLLQERGIRQDLIVLEPRAEHTDENIYYSSLLMEENGWRSALVVSENPGHFIYTAICDANCCVRRGELTLVELDDLLVGYYTLDQLSTADECSHISTLGMCMNLPSRDACQ